MEGFRWYFDQQLALVWSAPNYAYVTGNKATVMQIAEKGAEAVFEVFTEDPRSADPPEKSMMMQYFT